MLDEAYREFVTDPDVPDGIELMRGRPNVAVLRTFSKAWGLAGLRVGYLVAEENEEERVWRITSIAEGKAVLDGNHELAGQRLRFEATVVEVRPATKEEITHGHVHGAHGHHH